MGRGNACVRGKYEGLFYVAWDNFPHMFETESGDMVEDYEYQRRLADEAIEEFSQSLVSRCKSFNPCDVWLNDDERAILENKLFYIAVQDNEWSIAVKLLQKDDGWGNNPLEGLQAGLYGKILEAIKESLFEQFNELGTYSGAWTSGTIKRANSA